MQIENGAYGLCFHPQWVSSSTIGCLRIINMPLTLLCRLCMNSYVQVASLTLLAQLLPPRSPTVSNPAPDSSLCRAAAPRLCPLAPRLHPLQLLLAACVRFESSAAPWPDCIHIICCFPFASAYRCCSPISHASAAAACSLLASTSAAAPDRVCFDCCSPHQLAATPQLDSSPMFSNILRGVRGSVNKLKYKGRTLL